MLDGTHEREPRTSPQDSPAESARPLGMTPALFRAFRELASRQAGIQLRDGKEDLLATRIARRMRDLGVTDAGLYLSRIRADATGEELVRFLDCISINLTSFYREEKHFQILAKEAALRLSRGERRFRVWSAAVASGEEAYTAAITLAEVSPTLDHRIYATDISTRALAAARLGRYTASQLEPMPERLRWKHFTPVAGPEPLFEVSPRLRERVAFGRINLAAAAPFPMSPVDVILCRNVMIYLDQAVRRRLVTELARLLRPGGLLMVGHAETLTGLPNPLTMVCPSVYRRPRDP